MLGEDTGIVHEDIHAAERTKRLVPSPVDALLRCEVGVDHHMPFPGELSAHHFGEISPPVAMDGYPASTRGERPRDGGSDAARSSGDQGMGTNVGHGF